MEDPRKSNGVSAFTHFQPVVFSNPVIPKPTPGLGCIASPHTSGGGYSIDYSPLPSGWTAELLTITGPKSAVLASPSLSPIEVVRGKPPTSPAGTAPSGTSTPTSNTPLPTTDTTAPGTASLTSSGGYSEALGSGYTASGSLELGSVQHAAPNLRVGNVVLGAACTVNNETDAVVPWTLTITNTTASFSLTGLGATALLVGPDGTSGISGGSYEYVVNGQPQCADQATSDNGGAGSAAWEINGLEPQQSLTLAGFEIIPNYYSPANPNGAGLSGYSLEVGTGLQSSGEILNSRASRGI